MFFKKKCFIFLSLILFILPHAQVFSLTSAQQDTAYNALKKLETSAKGQLGVYAINTSTDERLSYRAEQRFPMCSTAKMMVVAAILKQENLDGLQKKLAYTKKNLVTYSPITEKYMDRGMTIAELCEATITVSDNTAMNLLLQQLGGLSAVNRFARSINDNKFRLDRREPALNNITPGDFRDTTTPKAMANSLNRLMFSDVLAVPQREMLETWLKNNKTGNARIRAGVPSDWVVGDKTGTCGQYGMTNDAAVIWPKKCSPIVVAIFFKQDAKNAKSRDDVIAAATRILINAFDEANQC